MLAALREDAIIRGLMDFLWFVRERWALFLILVAAIFALAYISVPESGCQVLGVAHVNDAPLLYKDCNGQIVREYLWVGGE